MTQSKVPGPNLGTVTISGTVTEKQDQPAATAATWTSATGANTAVTVNTTGYGTANVFIVVPATVTAGVITIEVSMDAGTTYVPAGAVRVDNGYQENVVPLAFAPGINGSRMYAVSVDAMTQVRARLSTVITGSGNVVVTVSSVAGGIEPFVAIRPRMIATYAAAFRIAIAASNLSLPFSFTANTDKQVATIYHAASATKTVRVRFASIMFGLSNASIYGVEMRALSAATAPATGTPVITPRPYDTSDPAAEATCLALPGTAGSDAAVNSPVSQHFIWNSAATGTQVDPARAGQEIVLHNSRDGIDRKPLTMRAGVAEGFAIVARSTAAVGLNFTCFMEFTEESP